MRYAGWSLVAVVSGILWLLVSAGGRCEELKLQRISAVAYAQRGDLALTADVYMPQSPGPRPGILMVHGGAWMAGNKWNMWLHANQVARGGYTVVSINYRLAPRHKFPAQLEDCKEAVRWMRRNAPQYGIDPQRIAGFGYSAGGHLVSLLGVTDPDDGLEGVPADSVALPSTRLQAVVAGGAPCDFQWIGPNNGVLRYFLGGTRKEKPELYRQVSPTTFVSPDDPPFFFYHGETDSLVPRRRAQVLMDRLSEAGVPNRMYVVPGQGHLGAFLDPNATRVALEFLDEVFNKGT